MAFGIDDLISGVKESRRHFLKHLKGLRDEQWNWKPYPECKSVRETLAHLISDDRATIYLLEHGKFPNFDEMEVGETDVERLLTLLADSHQKYCSFVKEKFAETQLDSEVAFFGGKTKLGLAIAGISSEDYYHAGQVAFIRMATDPSWDYYASIYGGE
jgi:uncharacterized damage-inducible protein DinB